jgi:hypothetical protein
LGGRTVLPGEFITISIPAPDFLVVYDGECPVCTRFFPRYLNLLKIGVRGQLVNARGAPALVDALMRIERINIDRDAAVFFHDRWFAGPLALGILFSAAAPRSTLVKFIVEAALTAVYPALRIGRFILLRLLGRRRLKIGG